MVTTLLPVIEHLQSYVWRRHLAARLTSLARPGTALVDAELAAALRPGGRYRLQHRRPAAVRGYHHLRSWALRPRE